MISKELDMIMNDAIRRANNLKHEYLTLENVFLALLDDPYIEALLSKRGVNVEAITKELKEFIEDENNFSILSEEAIENLNNGQFLDKNLRELAAKNGIRYQPEISLALQRVIQRAAIHVQSSGKREIRGINILVAMFGEKESFALFLLKKYGIERFDIVQAVSHTDDRPINDIREGEQMADEPLKKGSSLNQFTINLNELARNNKLDPIIGRDSEITRIKQVLCRRHKNNPLLVGESGVGKTSVAYGMVWAIIKGDVPEVLKNAVIYDLDVAGLVAGAKYRGDFEGRFKAVISELSKKSKDNLETPIIYIDEIHTVIGTGAIGNSGLDASNLLRPVLNENSIRCMGSTTYEEYRKFVEKDHAFNRRFQKIDIEEPSEEDCLKILQGLRQNFEDHHNVKYSNVILKAVVNLSHKHIGDKKLPDKAIDVMDEAGAKNQLLPKNKRKRNVSLKDIEGIVSSMAKIPKQTVAVDEREKLKNLYQNLKLFIFGQDEAVKKVTDFILMARSGLGHPERPVANFLFTGPTGVGKTELARQLAFNLGVNFLRFDMSEFMEKHAVSKLIGAPPGYVGFDKGGILTDAIKKDPYSVLLLDEIEKAHQDIFNILLQVMDHGRLADAHGRITDFRNVILIMTTNAGAKEMEAGIIGLSKAQNVSQTKRDKVIKNFFSPEFRNRLDDIINFSKLSNQNIIKIVEKFLVELESQLSAQKISISMDDEVIQQIANNGFDSKMGARPILRLINDRIRRPLSHELLFGELNKNGKIHIFLDQDGRFQFKSLNNTENL